MNNRCIMCAWDCWGNGGVETYIFRMFKWAKENDYMCCLFVPNGSNISNYRSKFEELKVKIIYYNWSFGKKIISIDDTEWLNEICENIIISFSVHVYVVIEKIKVKFKNWKHLYYVLHPYLSRISENRLLNLPYRKVIKKLFLNENIIFMDEETYEACLDYYGERITGKKAPNIQRLGVQIACKTPPCFPEKRSIMTITRMDFPFKGYIFGLIDDFVKLNKYYKNAELVIIGDGPQLDLIKCKIDDVGEEIKNKISLVGYVEYERIKVYALETFVYIGMGTTLIDVCQYSVPGIVASSYQMGPFSPGIFIRDTLAIDGMFGTTNWNKTTFFDEIDRIFKMSEDEYVKLADETYNGIKNHYNIQNVMDYFVEKEKKDNIVGNVLTIYDYGIVMLKKVKRKRRNYASKKV